MQSNSFKIAIGRKEMTFVPKSKRGDKKINRRCLNPFCPTCIEKFRSKEMVLFC